MGWWFSGNDDDILGDGPADLVTEALTTLVQWRTENDQQKLTLQQLLDAVFLALSEKPESFLSNTSGRKLAGLTTVGAEGTICSSTRSEVESEVIHELRHEFSEIAAEYEDSELGRKPRVSELLDTIVFVLRPDAADYLADGSEVEIEAIHPEWEVR